MRATLAMGLIGLGTLFAKDKPAVNIQVVDTQTSERSFTQYIPGTAATSMTNCNSNASAYGTGSLATAYGTTNCMTTTNPGTAPRTVQRSIQQAYVRAVLPDGRHIRLWCQAGFRRCSNLSPGSYAAELSGNTVWVQAYDLDGIKHHKVKYRFSGGW